MMTELTAYETTWLGVLEELRGCPEIRVTEVEEGELRGSEDADRVFGELAEREGIALDASLKQCHLRFSDLGAAWSVRDPEYDEESLFAGEFHLTNIHQAIRSGSLETRWFDPTFDPDPTPEELRFYRELRSFDGTPWGGIGNLSMLRIRPGVTDPELWFDTTTKGLHRLDLDYPGYLEALRITKGTYGWQFLFADVRLDEYEDFEVVGRFAKLMLEVFPRLFPDHDYAPLRSRLAERHRGFRA
ncbi:hypothetical protein OU416_15210 [Saccharopolyspora indica]|nr:hypothetical protein [Saccharopolyspora indica]